MHGQPALPPDFKHLPYVNPSAPKGGRITLGTFGTFDSLNPMIVRGIAAEGLTGLVYESLLARNANEPFSLYGLIAKHIEVAEDRSAITFHLDPKARFSDGKPVTAEDVVFSWRILRDKGRPYMRGHYSKVKAAEILGPGVVRFSFGSIGDREIPLIMGLMPVLPRHAIDEATFNEPSLKIPIGSGPYVVDDVAPGTTLTLRRNPKYWGRHLPIRRGMHNASEVRYLYYRDNTALFEAFKAGKLDFRSENDPGQWVSGYDFPAIKEGRARKYTFETQLPAGMTGLVFNTRRDKFKDQRVRQAIILAFDARRINKQFFHGRYVRTESFFARSTLASTGHPASSRERSLLAPFGNVLKPDIMAGTWHLPTGAGDDGNRTNLRKAYRLLREAGYVIRDGRLLHRKSGQLAIEFMVLTRAQARVAVAFGESLRRLGIDVKIRQAEDSQYWARLGSFDYDMLQWTYPASLSPGNEQFNRWHSRFADTQRSLNLAGVRNPAVDAMIEVLLTQRDRAGFKAAVRALDRALLSGDYVVPLFHLPKVWVAASSRLDFPKTKVLFGTDVHMWWVKPGQ
ncbi:MAG: ABC transporter substrate-binding protein [Hyphomicrobiaceae bacterium]|nr:ABC transporter substrate-binding protein [Hyphomicrobiaceae bacterium]